MRRQCLIDPFSPSVRGDPYPHYRRLREEQPVSWSPQGFWLAFRHADVASLLRDPRCDHWDLGANGESLTPQEHAMAECLELLSPRAPGQLRSLVMTALSGGRIRRLEAGLLAAAHSLLEATEGKGAFDVVADLAAPLTFEATADMLGVPAARRAALRAAAATGPPLLARLPMSGSGSDGDRFESLVHEILDHRREHRSDDLTSAIWNASEAGDPLSRTTMANLFLFLLYAGHENIASFISNAALSLLLHPEQAAVLRGRPELAGGAFDELLRFDGPVHFVRLKAREPIRLGEHDVAAGETIFACLASANRDPEVFADPDRLDLARTGSGQLGFGAGPLRCIGAALAKAEGAAAIRALFERFADLRLPERFTSSLAPLPPVLRGLERLPVLAGGGG